MGMINSLAYLRDSTSTPHPRLRHLQHLSPVRFPDDLAFRTPISTTKEADAVQRLSVSNPCSYLLVNTQLRYIAGLPRTAIGASKCEHCSSLVNISQTRINKGSAYARESLCSLELPRTHRVSMAYFYALP